MTYRTDKHHRCSIRLRGYDYSRPGAYFITICAQNRECLFGDIVNGEMRLNDAGVMVQSVWDEIPAHYPGIYIDVFIVMPNHIHGIVVVGAAPRGRPDVMVPCGRPGDVTGQNNGQAQGPAATTGGGDGNCTNNGQARGPAPTAGSVGLSLPDVVNRFKSMTTKRYADGAKQNRWPTFSGKLWQRNYYEHIIRNENELNRSRQYIMYNPVKWDTNRENPKTMNR
ncbi:MAG: transposase [Pseudomonadota bacterium]|nr:transposase [Pseudomonadota bacterium]